MAMSPEPAGSASNGPVDHLGPGRILQAARYGGFAFAMAVAAALASGYGVAHADSSTAQAPSSAQASSETTSTGNDSTREGPAATRREKATDPKSDSTEAEESDQDDVGDLHADDDADAGGADEVEAENSDQGDVVDWQAEADADADAGADADADAGAEDEDEDEDSTWAAGSSPHEEPLPTTAVAPDGLGVAGPGSASDDIVSVQDDEIATVTRSSAPVHAVVLPTAESFTVTGQPSVEPASVVRAIPGGQPVGSAVEWSLLGWIRRTFFNQAPVIRYRPEDNVQGPLGVITGSIGAADPEGDALKYIVTTKPRYGTVVIDQRTGTFTYTPNLEYAQAGGVDRFVVRVTDGKLNLLHFLRPDFGVPRAKIGVEVSSILPPPSSSPPLEAFVVEKTIDFDVPAGVAVTGADLSPDGEYLILEVKIDGKTQVAVSDLDGGNYQCISCGVVTNAAKARAFGDNERIWFASTSGQQSADDPLGGAGLITYAILECGGSIYSCASPTVRNVEFPSDRGPLASSTQNREAKPDPFGEYVTWTENTPITGPRMSIARLVATETGYTLVDQRIFSPQWDEETEYAQDFVNATRFYEGASWHAGGRYLKYQTTTTGLNYDIWLLDTATGERRQLTTDLDYNESGDVSPDGTSVYFSSARGADRMDVFTALVRPSLIDSAAFPQIGRVSLWNNRRSMNEPWVMNLDAGQQLGGYSGQPIIIDPDWTIRGWSWFPDSTRALINEQQRPDIVTPGAPDTPWRFSVISFPTREATTPLAPVRQDPEAIARWSVPVEDYNPMMGRQVPSRVLKGTHSGTATLHYVGNFASGAYSVTYENYSDDGKTFINGTETVTVVNPIGNATWSADLTSTGERTGYLKGSIKAGRANAFSGTVSSEINGVTYSGVPTQLDYPVIDQPQLAISSFGDRVRVTATVAEDGEARPVRGATVTVGNVTATTDAQGYVLVVLAPGDSVTASAGGFRSVSSEVPFL